MGKVIAFDVDGCLCKECCWTPEDCLKATPIQKNIDWCNELFMRNFVVIYTARKDELILATLEWLRKHNVRYQAFSNFKMGADIYIDDRAINSNEKMQKMRIL